MIIGTAIEVISIISLAKVECTYLWDVDHEEGSSKAHFIRTCITRTRVWSIVGAIAILMVYVYFLSVIRSFIHVIERVPKTFSSVANSHEATALSQTLIPNTSDTEPDDVEVVVSMFYRFSLPVTMKRAMSKTSYKTSDIRVPQ